MRLRTFILQNLALLFPVRLSGDAEIDSTGDGTVITCIINFYGRSRLLENILSCLAEQDIDTSSFEVLLVEDRNGTDEGRDVSERFSAILRTRYIKVDKNYGTMGYARNVGLEKANGRYILLLDDDTVILQRDFLSTLINEFETTEADAVLPRGTASFCLYPSGYQYHDEFFPTNRCVAYRRETISELGGFVSGIIGQEDVEFTVRLLISGKKIHKTNRLGYMHPPLICSSTGKSAAVGLSFAGLRDRYGTAMWLMLLLNGCRYIPLMIFPFNEKYLNQAKFSTGFLKGLLYALTGKSARYG